MMLLHEGLELHARGLPHKTAMVAESGRMTYGGFDERANRLANILIEAKIPPTEVEFVVLTHPAVSEVAYVGVPDASGAQIPTLFVVLKEGQDVSRTELRAFCGQVVADYKLPQRVEFMAELPKIASGKIDRRVLQERGN
jgi:acyl-CoA synthetase (AMP-forming)/AMP-acid ligase II